MTNFAVFRSILVSLLAFSQFTNLAEMPAAHAQNSFMESSNTKAGSTEKGALGMVVNYNQMGRLYVTNIVPGGPAASSNVTVGDEVLAVEGISVNTLPPEQIYQKLVGAPGTSLSLSLQSPARGNYQVSLTRISAGELEKNGNFKVGYQDNRSANPTGLQNTSPAAASTTMSANTDWNSYGGKDQGFSINYPKGWSIQQDEKTGKIEMSSPAQCKLSIFPFFIPSRSVSAATATGIFTAMLKQYAPETKWSAPDTVTGALRATAISNGSFAIAGLALSASGSGTAGQLIVLGAPANPQAQSDLTKLGQILQSFKITGIVGSGDPNADAATGGGSDVASGQSSAASALPEIQYTTFNDPNFGAFSLDVPVGWDVTGGLKRPIPIDLRPWMKAVSPGQKMVVFIGDGSIEPRYLPAAWLSGLGCPPGSMYKHSNGMVSKVLYYQNAEQFAKNYAENRFGKNCDSFQLVKVEHHPDLAREINGTQGVMASDAASVRYDFTLRGNRGTAYFLAATKKGPTMWWVSRICGVVASEGYEQQALQVFERMYKSWQYNQQWEQGQAQQNVKSTQDWLAYDSAARARSAAAFSARMAAMDARHNSFMNRMREMDASHARYMSGMRSSDRAHSDFINYIHDEDTLMNASTGEKFQVEYGPKYHWVNSAGNTVLGTDSAWSPGVNWTELVKPPKY